MSKYARVSPIAAGIATLVLIVTQNHAQATETKTSGHARGTVCDKLRWLFVSNTYSSHAIPFTGKDESQLQYALDFKASHSKGTLIAWCGYGAESLCDMELRLENGKVQEFTLPATQRLIELSGHIYIVNGVEINAKHEVSLKNYMVHELHPDSVQLVCET